MSGTQTIGVDSVAPTLSVDTLAQDNIINAAEHSQPLTLTGKTTAEAGQIVTVTLNGKNYNATVGSDGTGPSRLLRTTCRRSTRVITP